MRRLTSFFTLLCSCTLTLAQTDCANPHDSNSDGAVTISDLLDLLGLFGDIDTDHDGVWDSVDECVDTGACNYAASPTEACAYIDVLGICGGGCEGDGDGDGICDDVDTCVGDLDECGVCNGPGPTEMEIESITILYDSVYLPQLEEWYVYEFGADTTFTYTCAPLFGDCGTVSYQGYDYATVLIGEQCWFAENLLSENFQNGDPIPAGLSDSEWENTQNNSLLGAVAVYGEDEGCWNGSPDIDACDPNQSLNEYGRLYNFYSVYDARGLCPSGWHVPTAGEWVAMIEFLGGFELAGDQLKTEYGWDGGFNGLNSSGFSGLPGGKRDQLGFFDGAGIEGSWWCSATQGYFGYYISLVDIGCPSYPGDCSTCFIDQFINRIGRSVRCIQDSE